MVIALGRINCAGNIARRVKLKNGRKNHPDNIKVHLKSDLRLRTGFIWTILRPIEEIL